MVVKKKLRNKFVVVVTARSANKWIKRCLRSIINQDFEDLGIIAIDDNSEDKSFKMMRNILTQDPNTELNSITLKTDARKYVLYNINTAIEQHIETPETIVGIVDGDDFLLYSDAVSSMYNIYFKNPAVLIAWSQYISSRGVRGSNRAYKEGEDVWNKWISSHFKTFKKSLYDKVDKRQFLIDKDWITRCNDQALMRSMLHLTKPHERAFLDRVFYHYNVSRDRYGANDKTTLMGRNEVLIKSRKYYVDNI